MTNLNQVKQKMDNLIKKYRVIGDIHGRKNWWDLVNPFDKETLYIFLGDYTDPYPFEGVTFDQMVEQIEKMFDFKREHPDNVIILIGNHDLQYIMGKAETNRYDYSELHRERLMAIFEDERDSIHGVAYNIGDKYLISHAGVTIDWYTKYCTKDIEKARQEELSEIVGKINKLWSENKESFTFRANAKMSDHSGISSTQSPLWVRPLTLWYSNFFGHESGKIQVVGHTIFDNEDFGMSSDTCDRVGTIGTVPNDVEEKHGWESPIKAVGNDPEHVDIIMADCLRRETACVDIDAETLEWKKFYIGDTELGIDWD